MSLKNILLDISSVLSLDITDPDEKAYHVEKINEAAQELYTANDLPGCLREQLFQIDDSQTYQVSFPFYVDKIRAARFYNNWIGPIPVETMTPRYHSSKWGNKGLIKLRIKGIGMALCRDLQDISPLIFTLSNTNGEAAAVSFNIVGQTVDSQRVYETVTIPIGSYTVTTVNNYKSVEKIEKTALNTLDCVITNLLGTEVARIPNSELKSSYTIAMIREDEFAPLMNNSYPLNTIELLYKLRFTPMRELYDEFPCPNCDKIIFWKFCEHYYSYKPGMEEQRNIASRKCKKLIQELFENDSLGSQLLLEFGANTMYEGQECASVFKYPYGPPDPIITYTN